MTSVKAALAAADKNAAPVRGKKSISAKDGGARKTAPKHPRAKPETKGAWIREQCTKADLSLLMNVSIRSLTDLDQRGKLVRAPKAGLYLTLPTLNACWDSIRLVAAGRVQESQNPAAVERLKSDTIDRQIREITLKKLKGEVLTLEEVDESWSTFAGQVKAVMLTVPGKARTRIPHLTAHDQETLRAMIKDMLVDLAAEVEASVIGGSGQDLIE
jgi:phage terminase Nu1 subunit (DNA packaging protein)